MNGIIDQQLPTWAPPPPSRSSMQHGRIPTQITSSSASAVIDEMLTDLDRQMDDHFKEFDMAVQTLRSMYIFSDHDQVKKYLSSNRTIAPVLIEAFPHMSRAFGGTPLVLDVTNDDGSTESINVLALWWGKREDARAALQSFDDSWLLDNVRKSGGRIVFDYQIEK